MDQARSLITLAQQHSSDISIGILVFVICAIASKVLKFCFTSISRFGTNRLGRGIQESIAHVSAYNQIKTDPVMSLSYIGMHLSEAIWHSVLFLGALISFFGLSSHHIWMRTVCLILIFYFFFGLWKRGFAICSFYAVTSGLIIEKSKKENVILKNWRERDKTKPFIELAPTQPVQPPPPPPAAETN